MFQGNVLANYRAVSSSPIACDGYPKTCHSCKKYKSTANGTFTRLSALSNKRVFVCADCRA